MKKLTFIILGALILGVSSCKKVTEEYYTVSNQTIFYSIPTNNWTLNSDGKSYSATLTFADNDKYLNTYDGLLVYLSYDNGVNYISIPQTYNGISYSFSVNNQQITIDGQNSDGSVISSSSNVNKAATVKVVQVISEE